MKVVVHPEYNKSIPANADFDIAIGVLSKAQNRTWNFTFPTLATSEPPANNSGIAVGFGETGPGVGSGSRNSGALAVSGFVSGKDSTGATFNDGLMQLNPVTSAYQMVCPGDTGAPFFVSGQLAGVASFVANSPPCSTAGPAYEVPVARLNAWIKATLNQVDPPGACEVDDAAFATEDGGCEDHVATHADMECPLTRSL